MSLIAQGGMGQVYLGERADGQFEQPVAIKVMRETLVDPMMVKRFKAERQILASLDLPNLAKVLDGGITEEGVPYFVMERMVGVPIDVYAQGHLDAPPGDDAGLRQPRAGASVKAQAARFGEGISNAPKDPTVEGALKACT